MKKIMTDPLDMQNTFEGFEGSSGCQRLNRWRPKFDNILPDGKQRVTVKTAVDKPYSAGTGVLAKSGQINSAGGSFDWLSYGKGTLLNLGTSSWTDFDDESLVDINYNFLYDPSGWNKDKKCVSESLVTMAGEILEFLPDSANVKRTGVPTEYSAWAPGVYIDPVGDPDPASAYKDVKPFVEVSYDFLQGKTWW